MPIVLVVQVIIIYLLFYQYDRCLLEQDCATLAITGVALLSTDNDTVKEAINTLSASQSLTHYLAWEADETTLSIKTNLVTVKKTGAMQFPFSVLTENILEHGAQESAWEISASTQAHLLSPPTFVRTVKKLKTAATNLFSSTSDGES